MAAGDLDANAFQHKPFLNNQIKSRGFDIVPVGLAITAPPGFYSRARSRSWPNCPAAPRSASRTPRRTATALLLASAGPITPKTEAVRTKPPRRLP